MPRSDCFTTILSLVVDFDNSCLYMSDCDVGYRLMSILDSLDVSELSSGLEAQAYL